MKIPKSEAVNSGQPVTEIAKGIYRIRIPLDNHSISFMSALNSYFIQGNSGWLMIDAGWFTPFSFDVLKESLHKLSLDFSDISTIILTHSHSDHYGMVGKIKQQAPKIQLLCHQREADLIESRYIKFTEPQKEIVFLIEEHGVPEEELPRVESASISLLQRVTIALPDKILCGGETISTGIYDLEVFWTPGHAPGHICLYESQNQLLFCGDHVLPTVTPNIGYNGLSGDNPLGDYLRSLNKLVHLPVSSAHPGHEYPFTDLNGRIEAIIEHHRRREIEIHELIVSKYSNSYEIARRLNWSLDLPWKKFAPLQKRLAITETIAHLEHMCWKGKVSKTIKNNRITYSAIPDP